MNFKYRFSIDIFNKEYISGWCYNRLRKSQVVELELCDGDVIVERCAADLYREDLETHNIHPNGKCGFTFFLSQNIDWDSKEPFVIQIGGSARPLVTLDRQRVGEPVTVTKNEKLVELLRARKSNLSHPVFFLHIPKTAGTSFNAFVQSTYVSKSVTHAEAYSHQSLKDIAQRYRYVSAHLRIDQFYEFFPPTQYRWMTILREPYAHFHSHLNWLRSVAVDEKSAFYNKHNATFKEIANRLKHNQDLTPGELQSLVDSFDLTLCSLLENCQTRYLVNGYRETIEESDTEEAIKNLGCFYGVGVTEKFDDFIRFFLSANETKTKRMVSRMNKAKLKPLFDHRAPEYREIIAAFVKSDCILYEKALNMLP